MQEKISVIVPIYNVEKYLDRCVNSIVNQTYQNLEIILVDDGSPDNCGIMCDDWALKDSRIKVVHKQNGGLSDARNAGLDICSGDYITFVDSDDLIDKIFVERLLNIAKDYNASIVSCSIKRFKNILEFSYINDVIISEYTCKQSIVNTIKTKDMVFIVSWGKLYKKEIFNTLRFEKGVYHEDEFITHKILHLSNKFIVTNEQLYYYYYNDNSITGAGYKLKRIDLLKALFLRGEFLKEHYLEIYNALYVTFYLYRCIDLFFEIPKDFKDKKEAKKQTKKYFNMGYKNLKLIKTPSKIRFLIFKFSPWLYRRLFKR